MWTASSDSYRATLEEISSLPARSKPLSKNPFNLPMLVKGIDG